MASPLLETKLHVPRRRRGLVARPRLMQRLGRAGESALTLVSAPAGFGKTTLLAEWLAGVRGDGRSAAWLSLDQSDNDPATFWPYLITALRTAEPSIGAGALTLLQSPQPPIEAVLAALLNDLDAITNDVVLVLDDFHLIDRRDVQTGVAFLLEHLPEHLHIVIAGRADPALPLALLRSRGELVEIRAADLRFTPIEAAEYLNESMGLTLTADDVAALEARTEGWIAALQMAALSMQGRDDVAAFIAGFAGDDRFIVDYLAEEVLQRQPDDVQDFLLQTSILDRLSGPLCDAVTGQDGCKAKLAALERGNLFLVPLDDRRQWYRYHRLFADVLQAHLRDEQPDHIPDLHRRASFWFERNGEPSEAIRHALAGGDVEHAANLVELSIPLMRRTRQEAALREWLEALPDEMLRSRPVLSVGYAGVLVLSGDLPGIEARLKDAERWLGGDSGAAGGGDSDAAGGVDSGAAGGGDSDAAGGGDSGAGGGVDLGDPGTVVGDGDPGAAGGAGIGPGAPPEQMVVVDDVEFRRLPVMIELYRAAQALARGDGLGAVNHAGRALKLAPPDDFVSRAPASGLLGLAYWAGGDLEAGHSAYAECMEGLYQAGFVADTFGCAIALADIRIAQGRLREAQRTYELALRRAAEQGGPALRGTADMYVGISDICRERGDLPAATANLLRTKELGEQAGLPQNPYRRRVAAALVRRAQGDLAGALALLDEAERMYVSDFFPNVRPIPAVAVRVWLAQGLVDDAMNWVREQGLSADDDLHYLREYEHITLARVMMAGHAEHGGDYLDRTAALLARLLAAAEAGERTGSVIEILVLQALAQGARGDLPAALAPLRRALTLAEPEGYVRIFADEGQPMAALLRAVAKTGFAPGYVRRLLAATSLTEEERPAKQGLIEQLSAREIDVLRLLGTDLDGPDIARHLVVSLNTVRTHTKNIYAKLGVNNRRAAVRRAQELDLMSRNRDQQPRH